MEAMEGMATERDEGAMEAMEDDTVDTERSIMVDMAEDDTMVVTTITITVKNKSYLAATDGNELIHDDFTRHKNGFLVMV